MIFFFLTNIRFIGNTQFSEGTWIGILLKLPKGKNNGTGFFFRKKKFKWLIVNGITYFVCEENYGIFVKENQIKIVKKNTKEVINNSLNNKNEEIQLPINKQSTSSHTKKKDILPKRSKSPSQVYIITFKKIKNFLKGFL